MYAALLPTVYTQMGFNTIINEFGELWKGGSGD